MRFNRVTAEAFGPLVDEELDLSGGLNVIWGPNEAAKSSWHAALYAALCGRRRGRGAAQKDEGFRRRHEPWDGDRWSVSAIVDLDDGRSIRLAHDLANKHSDVIDAQLGRPVDDDIVHDGSPDAAVWLGLDRSSFLATACVKQADIGAVVDDPDGIRELMQRAASTLGGEVTAARAIDAITAFKKEAVGQDRANAVKPLRRAIEAHDRASGRLDATTRAHGDYQALLAEVDQASSRVDQARADHDNAVQRVRRVEAHKILDDFGQIELLACSVDGSDNTDDLTSDTDIDILAGLVIRWDAVDRSGQFDGPTLDEIETAITAMPPEPTGPTTEHPSVVDAADQVDRLRAALDGLSEPPPVVGADVSTLDEAEHRAVLARTPEPRDMGLVAALEVAQESRSYQRQHRMRRTALLAFGSLAAVVGLVLVLFGSNAVAVAAFVVAAAAAAGGLLGTTADDTEEVEAIEAALAQHREQVLEHHHDVNEANDWLGGRGFVADPASIRQLSIARSAADAVRERWLEQSSQLQLEHDAACERLTSSLIDQGISVVDLDEALDRYRGGVETNARSADARRKLPLLLEQRRERLREQQRGADVAHLCAELAEAIRAIRPAAPVDDFDDLGQLGRELLSELRSEQKHNSEHMAARQRLQILLADRTFDEVAAQADEAGSFLASHGSEQVSDDVGQPSTVPHLNHLLTEAEKHRSELSGRLNSVDTNGVDVAAAEAAVSEAEREVERVRRLSEVLDLTTAHLASAEADAFRRVAPLVARGVTQHIAEVTEGRYVEALVDPEALEVTVRDRAGRYLSAGALSHGTTEQVFLLLRLAMVKVLTAPNESCPFIIDDATVHADEERTRALLSLLHNASHERQIVLFTQETSVRDWARSNLSEGDRLIELAPTS